MATNRLNREAENREITERPKQWMPPELLPEPDKHEIVFKYEPLSLRLGVAITTITILVVFLVLILLYNSFLYGRKPDFGNRKRHKAALK